MYLIKKIVFVLIGIALFSSCIIVHNGNVSSGPLLNINDRYVDIACGEAKSFLVFGIGNYENDKLLQDAKRDLFKHRPLAKNEYYANFTSDICRKYIFFVAINKVSVCAEVLKNNVIDTNFLFFNDKRVSQIKYKNDTLISNNTKTNNTSNVPLAYSNEIHTGDSVYFCFVNSKKFNLYVATEIDIENVMLKSVDKLSKNVLTPLENTFYYKNKEFNNFKNGDRVTIEIEDDTRFTNKTFEGKILGVTNKTILVKTTEEDYYQVEPKFIKKLK